MDGWAIDKRDEVSRDMKAKGKANAKVDKPKRAARRSKEPRDARQPQSLNSSGEFPIHPTFPAGQDGERLRDEDWQFRVLANADRATLAAACLYEYARESQHVCETMWQWLRHKDDCAALEKMIAKGDPRLPREFIEAMSEFVSPTTPRAKDDPAPLSASFISEVIQSEVEHAVQRIEACGAADAPRLRTLAKYLVKDRPWLLVPEADRQRAIESAFADRHEVPHSAAGTIHFRAKLAFERVHWCDFVPPQFDDGELRQNGVSKDLYHREITRDGSLEPWRSAGDEILPVVIRWGQFSNAEIIEDFTTWVEHRRPNEWRHLAKRSGRGHDDWFYARLKELAAMRLRHFFTPHEARAKFRKVWHGGGMLNDETNFPKLAMAAKKIFAHFFPFGEQPRSGATWTQREKLRRSSVK